MLKRGGTVEIDGRSVRLTNLDKVLYPHSGFTKGDVVAYYAAVAPVLLSHLRGRPVTFRRYPNGVEAGGAFYEKHVPRGAPGFVRTLTVARSGRRDAGTIEYALLGDKASLVWAANLAAIELHVPMWRGADDTMPAGPDLVVFDLDPGPGTTIVECCEVAVLLEARLSADGLAPFAKTSGSKGLQLYARVDQQSFSAVVDYAHRLADELADHHRDLIVSNMRRSLRRGKVLIDWSQNSPAKTTVAPYSLRGRPEPNVSTPVSREETEACRKSGDPDRLRFLAPDVLERLERLGDLFSDLA